MEKKENFMNWDDPGTALITGASAGIGKEFAYQLAEQGFNIILVARREQKLRAIAEELKKNFGGDHSIFISDLSDINENMKLADYIKNKIENLDVLICNAGYGIWDTFLNIDIKDNINVTNLLFTSPMILCHSVLPNMKRRKRGAIINTASTAAFFTDGGGVYTATKAALIILSEILQERVKGTGVRIQALCPGFTYSEFHDLEPMTRAGFKRSWFPKEAWMEAKDLVKYSLKTVKNGQVMVVAGDYNINNIKKLRKSKLDDYLNLKIIH
ncbi:MAG: SDR family NAD(P)-dependent oxidoreductase [Candidatus Heimdallarchaeota archaeon]|nr:SDR family NAD(P)-dependent oxidoreductase [Candidatus Heimdallarchaeota archaeon]